MLCVMIVIGGVIYAMTRRENWKPPEPENPAELKPAIIFGLLYAAVLLGVAAARDHFGQAGLYTVAVLSGLTDMDAITLSTSQLASAGKIEPGLAWRAILAAALSNIVFKTGIVAVLGSRGLLLRVAVLFAFALAAGCGILWLWPL
jgi:uncharacterized membrane protein (DUF4010 family)